MFENSEGSGRKAPGVAASVDGHVTDDKASNSSDQAIERSVRPDSLTRQTTTAISALPKPAMRSIARPENREPNSPAQPFSLFGQSQSEQLSRERSISSAGGASSDSGGDSLPNSGRSALNILIGVMTVGAVFLIGLVSVLVHRRMYRNRYGLLSLILAVGCGLILVKFIGTACSAAAYF